MNGSAPTHCTLCNEPLEDAGVIDIPQIRHRLYQTHCVNADCELWYRTFTYRTERGDDYDAAMGEAA